MLINSLVDAWLFKLVVVSITVVIAVMLAEHLYRKKK